MLAVFEPRQSTLPKLARSITLFDWIKAATWI